MIFSVSVTFFWDGTDKRTDGQTDKHRDRQTFLGKYYSDIIRNCDLDSLVVYSSKIIFSEKSLSVPISVRPVPKVTETENFIEQSCQMYFKGDKNTFRITLMPLLCWARQS